MNLKSYNLIVFDLDNTLARSKTKIDSEMAILVESLLRMKKVAVISGGSFAQFEKELINLLSRDSHLTNLHIFPTDGTAYYSWNMAWRPVYVEIISDHDKEKIKTAINETLIETRYDVKNPKGEIVEDRISSIVFSALGQEAELIEKERWDPNQEKRQKIKTVLDEKLPDFEVRVAGTTSIDITPKGHDKGYGIEKMVQYLEVPIDRMIYIGDALFEGGNDCPVIRTGIKTIEVKNPEDTKKIIKEIIN